MAETTMSYESHSPITKVFLEKTLKKKIVSFKTSGGSNPGDNYMSILISIEVTLADEKEPLQLLFKTFPLHPTRQKMLEDNNVFLKELQVYDVWIPELIRFQKDLNNNKELLIPAFPELVAGAAMDYENGNPDNWNNTDSMLNNFLLMVDVRKAYGFKMANKLKSLDHQHVRVVIEELAKYHALGHAYKVHKNLNNIRNKYPFMKDLFFCNPSQKDTLESVAKSGMQLVIDSCKDFLLERPDIDESLKLYQNPAIVAEYIYVFTSPEGVDEEIMECLMRKRSKRFSGPPLKEQWISVGHGDCWTNNMLFKKDENGDVTGTILVDLQLARESCIMVDLVYFLYTSTDTDFRKEHLEEMLQLYYQKFVQFCDILKVKPFSEFSIENFMRKFHRSKILGLLFAILVLPIILQRPETTVNLDNMQVGGSGNTNDDFAQMFQSMGRDEDDNKLLRERFTKLFVEMYDEGVL